MRIGVETYMLDKNKDLRFLSLTWPTVDHGVEHLVLSGWISTFLALQRLLGWRTFSPEELAEPWSSASSPSTTTYAFFLATIRHLLQNNKVEVTMRHEIIDHCFLNTPIYLSINCLVQWFPTSLNPPTTKCLTQY